LGTPQPREPLVHDRQLRTIHDLVDEQEIADQQSALHAAARDLERLDEEGLDADEHHHGDHDDLRPVPEKLEAATRTIDVLQRFELSLGRDESLYRRLDRLRGS